MSDAEMIEKLRSMPMHQVSGVNPMGDFVIRVPSGWVYAFPRLNSTVFVPEPAMTVYSVKSIDQDEEALEKELAKHIEEVMPMPVRLQALYQ